jgi:hypothetical protein
MSHLKKLQRHLKKRHSDIRVQTMEISSVDLEICKATSFDEEDTMPEVNQENATHTIRESQTTRTPYRHANHKSRYFNQSKYQHRSEQKQLSYRPKNVEASTIENKLF